ncbi:hypothetical protein PR048_010768 [Dryococelus australis]|uniref:Uncharacterized protein n=1 Tax=Dryococelus australis TaxID=614101 RepID=A0ABQ9I3P4_9NEOP|nr:hypothetical protein PR048_010768 [Dryococelus australis]
MSKWSVVQLSGRLWAALNIEILRADEGEVRYTRKPADQWHCSGTVPTCENTGATPPEIKPDSPRWEASSLTTVPPRPHCDFKRIAACCSWIRTTKFCIEKCFFFLNAFGGRGKATESEVFISGIQQLSRGAEFNSERSGRNVTYEIADRQGIAIRIMRNSNVGDSTISPSLCTLICHQYGYRLSLGNDIVRRWHADYYIIDYIVCLRYTETFSIRCKMSIVKRNSTEAITNADGVFSMDNCTGHFAITDEKVRRWQVQVVRRMGNTRPALGVQREAVAVLRATRGLALSCNEIVYAFPRMPVNTCRLHKCINPLRPVHSPRQFVGGVAVCAVLEEYGKEEDWVETASAGLAPGSRETEPDTARAGLDSRSTDGDWRIEARSLAKLPRASVLSLPPSAGAVAGTRATLTPSWKQYPPLLFNAPAYPQLAYNTQSAALLHLFLMRKTNDWKH